MPDVMSDRRAAARYSLILPAVVIEQSSGTRLSARTSDISLTGCYIDTLNPMPMGTSVRVVLTQGGECFETLAQIVYVSPGLGMGIRFAEPVPPNQLALLGRWLESASRSTR